MSDGIKIHKDVKVWQAAIGSVRKMLPGLIQRLKKQANPITHHS